MKKAGMMALLFFLISLFLSESLGQRFEQGGEQSWKGLNPALCRRAYNPGTIETIAGEVVQVNYLKAAAGENWGWLDLTVKTARETLSVQMGPANYFNFIGFQVKDRDRIEVKGSRIVFQGKPAILASEFKRGNEILRLRDGSGYPKWIGWKKGTGCY